MERMNWCRKEIRYVCNAYDMKEMEKCEFFEENMPEEKVTIHALRHCKHLSQCRCESQMARERSQP